MGEQIKGVPWTQEEVDTLKELAASGVRAEKISSILGRSVWSIRARARRSKIVLNRQKYANWSQLIPQVLELKAQGYTRSEIAEEIGRSESALDSALQRYKHSKRQACIARLESLLGEYVSPEVKSELTTKVLALVAELSGATNDVVDF